MNSEELAEAGFQRACRVDEVGSPLPKLVELGERRVLVCREDGAYYAVDELCPHENQSMKFGVVFGGEITCPHHQYRFKLDTGRSNRRCAPLEVFKTEVFEDEVWVKL